MRILFSFFENGRFNSPVQESARGEHTSSGLFFNNRYEYIAIKWALVKLSFPGMDIEINRD